MDQQLKQEHAHAMSRSPRRRLYEPEARGRRQSKIAILWGVKSYEKKENLERNETYRENASWTCTWSAFKLETTPGRI